MTRAFLSDAGGVDLCSEVKIGLCRRLAATTVLAEMMEAKAINGEEIDVGVYCTLASTAVRISTRLNIERVARDVAPTLSDILRGPP